MKTHLKSARNTLADETFHCNYHFPRILDTLIIISKLSMNERVNTWDNSFLEIFEIHT